MKYFYIALIAIFLLFILLLSKDFLPWILFVSVISLPTLLPFVLKKLFPVDPEVEKRYPNYPFHRNWLTWHPLSRTDEELEDLGIDDKTSYILWAILFISLFIFFLAIKGMDKELNVRLEEKKKQEQIQKENNKKLQNKKTALVIFPKRF